MRKHLLAAASAVTLALGAAAPAHAYMVVDITDTGPVVDVVKSCSTQTAASILACSAAGFIVINPNNVIYSGLIGGYEVDVVGSVTNVPGTAIEASVDLSFTRVINNSSGGELFFNATGFGYTLPAGPAMTLFGSQSSSTSIVSTGGTVESQFYADPSNSGLFLNPTGCSTAVLTNTSCASPSVSWDRGAGPFSLTDIVIFDLNIGQDVNGSSNLTAAQVPEPASTALVGLALAGLGLFSRRRTAKA